MKQSKAMRVFEALSGVDEELLERSEAEKMHNAKVIPLWRYGKVMAVCFCLIVVGGLTWGALGEGIRSKNTENEKAMSRSMAEIAEEITADMSVDSNGAGNASGAGNQNGQSSMSGGNGISSRPMMTVDGKNASLEEMGEEGIGSQGSQNVIADTESMLVNPDERIGEKEAYATEALGTYIPVTLPDGYVFEGAYRGQDEQTKEYDSISITWSKGMDSIFWTVEKVEPSDIVLTDISKPETYNVHLYEIPYGETVPGEYWEAFLNPVFRAEDLSLELIESRMKVVWDAGDTDTPGGNFSVLYNNGILVRINADASSAEVWEILKSVKP